MPRTKFKKEKPKKPVAPAPSWRTQFTSARSVLEALYSYMGENRHFGALDTEPPYMVRGALSTFKRVPETTKSCWDLYSSYIGVGEVNQQIAKAVNVAIELTAKNGFGAKAITEVWEDIAGLDW